jgi:hypothetical protein
VENIPQTPQHGDSIDRKPAPEPDRPRTQEEIDRIITDWILRGLDRPE